jgi:PAS domain S-box-containing protein
MSGKESIGRTVNILLVDDKEANLLALQNLLEKDDRRFFTTLSGREALKCTLVNDIDLIILDVKMPEMDGFEVAEILRSNKKTKDIPIIFASAERKEHRYMMKGFDEGAVDYLYKPLDSELTKAKVAVFVKMQQQRKELIEKNQSLEKAALLINNSADVIGIIDPRTLMFEEVNQAVISILGYTKNDVLMSPITSFMHQDDAHHFKNLSIKLGQDRYSIETRLYSKNRSIKWFHWYIGIKDNKWFVNARDVTSIKEAERIKNYVAAVVKQSSEAIYIHDSEGTIISWNKGAEQIYGYTDSEALNMKIWNIIPEYLLPNTQKIFNQVLTGEKVQSLETKRISKRGKLVDVLFSATVITDATDNQLSIAITERDITKEKSDAEKIKQLNEQLQRNIDQLEFTNKELESFSYSVSHDLRAPLRAVNGNVVAIEEDYSDQLNDSIKGYLERIRSNAGKMNRQIDDLLAFSRLGKKEVQRVDVDMDELVKTTINELNESSPNRATFTVRPLSKVSADRSLLTHVISNLLSNAIKYSAKKDNPCVEVGLISNGNEEIFYVKDNGAGFDMRYAEKLFGTFQRLHSEDQFQGTGVGLAIVKRIINKHTGRVWAESKLNEGATFYFTIPSV